MPLIFALYPAFGSSFKDVQNFLITENIVRKASQLAGDLALIKARDADPENFSASLKINATETAFNDRIQQSIDDIIDIRESLGITTPEGRETLPLKDLLSPEKGVVFDSIF